MLRLKSTKYTRFCGSYTSNSEHVHCFNKARPEIKLSKILLFSHFERRGYFVFVPSHFLFFERNALCGKRMKISLQLFFQFAYKLFYFYSFLLTVYQWFLHLFPIAHFADYTDILLVLYRLPLRYWLSFLHYWTSAKISLQSSELIRTQQTLLETSSAISQMCLEVSLCKRHLQSSCLLVILPSSFFLMTGVSF